MLEPPKNIGQGIPLVEGVLSKIREILAYLEQSRLIPGKGIRLMETPSGIMVSSDAVRTAPAAASSTKKTEIIPAQYDGPFALRIEGSGEYKTIRSREGLIWTPTECRRYYTTYIYPLPSSSKLIVVSKYGELTAIDDDSLEMSGLPSGPDTEFWASHALLGRYDAETESVTQYHFSPIIFLITTEDFIITP